MSTSFNHVYLAPLTTDDSIFSYRDYDAVFPDDFPPPFSDPLTKEERKGIVSWLKEIKEYSGLFVDPRVLQELATKNHHYDPNGYVVIDPSYPSRIRHLARRIKPRQSLAINIEKSLRQLTHNDHLLTKGDWDYFTDTYSTFDAGSLRAGVASFFYNQFYSLDVETTIEPEALTAIRGAYGSVVNLIYLDTFDKTKTPTEVSPKDLLDKHFPDWENREKEGATYVPLLDSNNSGDFDNFDYWITLLRKIRSEDQNPIVTRAVEREAIPTLRKLVQESLPWATNLLSWFTGIKGLEIKDRLPGNLVGNERGDNPQEVAISFTPFYDLDFLQLALIDAKNTYHPFEPLNEVKKGVKITFPFQQEPDTQNYTLRFVAFQQGMAQDTLYVYEETPFSVSRPTILTKVEIDEKNKQLMVHHNKETPPYLTVTYCDELSVEVGGVRQCLDPLATVDYLPENEVHQINQAVIPFPQGVTGKNLREVIVTAFDPGEKENGVGYQVCQPTGPISIPYPDIYFDTNKDELKPDEAAKLAPVTAEIRKLLTKYSQGSQGKEWKVFIIGATDPTGTDDHNQKLSEARAKALADALHQELGVQAKNQGLPPVTFFYGGIGEQLAKGEDSNVTERKGEIYFGVDPPEIDLPDGNEVKWVIIPAESGIAGEAILGDSRHLGELREGKPLGAVPPLVQAEGEVRYESREVEVPPPPVQFKLELPRLAIGYALQGSMLTLDRYGDQLFGASSAPYARLSFGGRSFRGENSGIRWNGSVYAKGIPSLEEPFLQPPSFELGASYQGNTLAYQGWQGGLTQEISFGPRDKKSAIGLGLLEQITEPENPGGSFHIGTQDALVTGITLPLSSVVLGAHLYGKWGPIEIRAGGGMNPNSFRIQGHYPDGQSTEIDAREVMAYLMVDAGWPY